MNVREGLDAQMVNRELVTDANEKDTLPCASVGAAKKAPSLLQSAADIEPEAIGWLWKDWLAQGKVHILAGEPGAGKSTIAMAFASVISCGGAFPDGTTCDRPGRVLIWSGEDDPKDTLVPRLMAQGADRNMISFLGGDSRPFDPANDLDELRAELREMKVKGEEIALLIIDPIVSAVKGDSHKNAEVRRDLQWLVNLAQEFRCAVFGITHFSKNTSDRAPTERVTGSLAFGALARIVLVAGKCDVEGEGPALRVFARAKSNLGPDDGGFNYEIVQRAVTVKDGQVEVPAVEWLGAVQGSAKLLLDGQKKQAPKRRTETDECTDWLRDRLAAGPVELHTIQEEARSWGYSTKVMTCARNKLGVRSRREGFGGAMVTKLRLPDGRRTGAVLPTSASVGESENEGKTGAEGKTDDVKN